MLRAATTVLSLFAASLMNVSAEIMWNAKHGETGTGRIFQGKILLEIHQMMKFAG